MSAPGPDDYTLAENLQSVLANTMKSPHWNTASDGLVGGRPTLAAALAVPEVAALVEVARVLRDDFGSYKFNSMGPFYCTSKDPQFRQFDEALAKVDAIRAADPVTKSS